MTVGYSGTPLAKKLGIKEGQRVGVIGDPGHFSDIVAPLPKAARIVYGPRSRCDLFVVFTPTERRFREVLPRILRILPADGSLWISWPKKSSPLFVDMTEDTIRTVALPLGVVDTKVCAVDDDWSGLKLMVRRENVTVVGSDGNGGSDSESFMWNVSELANRDPVITDPGTMNNDVMDDILLLLTATDPDGGDVVVTVSGLPTGLSWNGSSVTGNPMISGTYEVTIGATDGVGGFASADFSWVISGALYLPFDDIGAGHPFATEITWMYAEGISFGCGDGTIYCPASPVTRAQIASFFAQAFGLVDGVGSNLFDDNDGSVHEDNIDKLATAGITSGCGTRLFCPSNDIIRAQFASLLMQALESVLGQDHSGGLGGNYFDDDDGSVHEDNIDKLAYSEITLGCGFRDFCSSSTLNRGQLAALLFRALTEY